MCENDTQQPISLPGRLSHSYAPHCSSGTTVTPAHSTADFTFKAYAPHAFRYFREAFGIKPADFLVWGSYMPCIKVLSVQLNFLCWHTMAGFAVQRTIEGGVQPWCQRSAVLPHTRRQLHLEDSPEKGGQLSEKAAAWLLSCMLTS